MQRGRPADNPLIRDGREVATLFGAANINFGYQTGFDLGLIRSMNECTSIEARYFQIDGWNAGIGPIAGVNGVVRFQPQLTGSGNDPTFGNYNSALRSAELNVRRQMNCWYKGLIGFRYFNLPESLNIVQPFGGVAPGFFQHTVNTTNNLFGGQIGGEACIWCRDRLQIDGFAKAGLYGNAASSFYHFTNFINGIGDFNAGNNATAQVGHTAFVGELSLTGRYCLNDHIAVRGGYQVMWIQGVTLSSDQFNLVGVAPGIAIDSSGGVFYHGATAGLELTW